MIDPIAAAQDALLAHLASRVALEGWTIRTVRGWPEWNRELKGREGPVLATVAGDDTRTPVTPRPLGHTEAEGVLTVTYRVELLAFPVQLDCWAPYKATLDDVVAQVNVALHNRLPHTSGCWLTSTGYHDRPLSFDPERFRREEEDAAASGRWRASWTLRCSTDAVVQATHPQAQQIGLDLNGESRPL